MLLDINCLRCLFLSQRSSTADSMQQRSKGKGASCGTKEKSLHTVPKSVRDVYDFDQHDSCACLQSKEMIAEFRSPRRVKSDTRKWRKGVNNKKLYSANATIEASYAGKTSTPCAVAGHQKTKKKTPGTPAPWVVLSRLQQNSLATYAVSPIAVEHHSPNDLSRQIDIDSMFDDTSSIMDSSIAFAPKCMSDNVGSDWNNKMSAASNEQCLTKDLSTQEQNSEKHKSNTDSGYPKFDSQFESISSSVGDNIGMAREGSEVRVDDLGKVNLPLGDSVDDQDVISAEKQIHVQNAYLLETVSGIGSADSDCEVDLIIPGTLDPTKFNSSDGRNSRKCTTKCRYQVYEDVEPSNESDDSDAGVVSTDIKLQSSVREKLNQSVEDAVSLCRKPLRSRALKTRNTAVDSKSTSSPSKKCMKQTDKKTEFGDMPRDRSLHPKKIGNTADKENAEMLEKPKAHRKPTGRQITESGSRKLTENVARALVSVEEEAGTGRPDLENGDGDGKCIVASYGTKLVSK